MRSHLTLDGRSLRDAFERVLPALSTDDTRPILTAANISVRDGVARIATTDSYRLHVAHLPVLDSRDWPDAVNVSGLRLAMAAKREPRASFVIDGECVTVVSDEARNGASVVDGTFPNVDQLLPDYVVSGGHYAIRFAMSGRFHGYWLEHFARFAASVEKCSRRIPHVRVTPAGDHVVIRYDREPFELSFTWPCELNGDVPEFGVNAKYLADALKTSHTLLGSSPTRPIGFMQGGDWALVMPVRLDRC